jgi:hypothetical protein
MQRSKCTNKWGKYEPDWGLYNGCMGTVIEIVYGKMTTQMMDLFHNML